MTIIDPDKAAAGRRTKIETVLDASASMEDSLTSVKGSIKGYEVSFRKFLAGLAEATEVSGLTYADLAEEMTQENDESKAEGLAPPHRYTSAGALSTLESVAQLSAMGGDLPANFVWRRPKQSAPLLDEETSITDVIWTVTNPGAKIVKSIAVWAKAQGVDPTTLYGKRVVTQAISSSSDMEEAVSKLTDALKNIRGVTAQARTLEEEAAAAAEEAERKSPTNVNRRWDADLRQVENALSDMEAMQADTTLLPSTGWERVITKTRLAEVQKRMADIADHLNSPTHTA